MPTYRIYRMKDSPRQHFRSAPHVSGAAAVKRKDYEEAGQVEAANEYALWQEMRGSEHPLDVGDLLETDTGDLRIFKYIGFEAAEWVLPPVETPGEPSGTAAKTEIGYTSADRPHGD